MKKITLLLVLCIFIVSTKVARAEDGYRLWLRYDLITNKKKLDSYKTQITGWLIESKTPTQGVAGNELQMGLDGLFGIARPRVTGIKNDGIVVIGTPSTSPLIAGLNITSQLNQLGPEGFTVTTRPINNKKCIVIASSDEAGVLYGVFYFLRLLQTQQDIEKLSIEHAPKIKLRVLNHWDNLDRTVERGYAGFSIWDWHKLPDYIDPRYIDYARANASVGINGTVLTNVNANALIITPEYLKKVAALADVFRPYGIKVYLTARFSAPIESGGLKTADPLDPLVRQWWKDRVEDIYKLIPDFGGFLVKANSEGQPGPQNYNRSHADGANMLAEAVEPHHGVVIWRAFVYDNNVPDDRAKQAYSEFKPLDGKFKSNVLVQVKNGAIDFQPREPFHPLFGAMPATPLMMEFQITQEYLGFSTHLVFLSNLFKETLTSDTYAKGPGSTVAKVIDGTLEQHALSGMAGIANIGTDRNWCGHPFAQANWYAFGRLAWDHTLTSEQIADEWIRMTFSSEPEVVRSIKSMMLPSHEIAVDYMTPLGLHHIMGWNHHYGPGPWVKDKPRYDWTSVYYHRADSVGVGFDRTATGSNALSQYSQPVQQLFGPVESCPEKYLLWFHHVKWNYKMKSGKSLWEALCYKYYAGVDSVRLMQGTWNSVAGKIDPERFSQVKSLLRIQEMEAVRWRNSCVLYFQTFARKPLPPELEKPEKPLEYYQKLEFPFAPGIRPRW